MYLYIYVCHASWPNEKRYRPVIRYKSSHRPENGFFVFSKKSPWRQLASKNCRVRWILRISPRLPYSYLNWSYKLTNFIGGFPLYCDDVIVYSDAGGGVGVFLFRWLRSLRWRSGCRNRSSYWRCWGSNTLRLGSFTRPTYFSLARTRAKIHIITSVCYKQAEKFCLEGFFGT